MINKKKIGVCIITYNSQEYFEKLFYSLPDHKYDELVVVNGGNPYDKIYKRMNGHIKWIQHEKNKGSGQSRNDGLEYLRSRDMDYYFIIEDDMVILDENIFDKYIEANKVSGLQYFCYASNAWGVGPRFARTPRMKVQYTENIIINLYQHCCNEFTFRTKELIDKVGNYNPNYLSMFDVDNIKRISDWELGNPFWYSPDLSDSDSLINNNPDAISRMNPDGSRDSKLQDDAKLFHLLHGKFVWQTEELSRSQVIEKLKFIKQCKMQATP